MFAWVQFLSPERPAPEEIVHPKRPPEARGCAAASPWLHQSLRTQRTTQAPRADD